MSKSGEGTKRVMHVDVIGGDEKEHGKQGAEVVRGNWGVIRGGVVGLDQ